MTATHPGTEDSRPDRDEGRRDDGPPLSGTGLARRASPADDRGGRGPDGVTSRVLAHLVQDNGELAEDVVELDTTGSTDTADDRSPSQAGVDLDVGDNVRVIGTTPLPPRSKARG